jgi:hypothetical protein
MTTPPENAGRDQAGPPAAKAAPKQRGQFKPGCSGNPSGKPKGCRNRATALIEAIADGDLAAIVAKIVEQAKGGDLGAAKLIFDRVAPPPRNRAVSIALPAVGDWNGAVSIIDGFRSVVAAVADGTITPSEGLELAELLDRQRSAVADLKPSSLAPQPTTEQREAEKRRVEQLQATFDAIGLGRF